MPARVTLQDYASHRFKGIFQRSPEQPRKSLLAGSLLCTLGVIRFSGTYVYPADGLCNLITFDSLFVTGGITLSPPYNDEFDTFLEMARRHRITQYAIGIDHKNENLMSDLIANTATRTTLDDMWSQRIHHYAQVNTPVMEAMGNPYEYVSQSARGLQMISQLMRDRAHSEGLPSLKILHYPLIYDSMAADVASALTFAQINSYIPTQSLLSSATSRPRDIRWRCCFVHVPDAPVKP
ncbi:hypothetical protein HPB51_020047 [Rhipicephalus microplus]|uniref:Uncharacterized protein n=1 Tax=Rhipicephalus microplus TaxID=6941 RepID=A0A9J6DVT0_RHIMP|nr:hypothetical protein HPB51_020047 [Rhipicephalus microplus]